MPKPSGSNRVNGFGRIPNGHLARTTRVRLDARFVGRKSRSWTGCCGASNVRARDLAEVSNVEDRVRLQSVHEIAEVVPIEHVGSETVAPEPDLVDGAVVGEKLRQLALEDRVISRRAVPRFV